MSQELPAHGHEVTSGEVDASDVPAGLANLALALRSAHLVVRRSAHTDLVHCQQFHLQSLIAGLVARSIGKGVIITVHGRSPRPPGIRGVAFRILERLCLLVPHQVVYVAESLQEALGHGQVIPNGVPAMQVRAALAARADVRKELGLDSDLTLLFLGRITEDKGFLILLTALERVRITTNARVHLLAIGPIEGRLREALQAKTGGRRDMLTMLGEERNPWRYFSAADVFVLPSFREGLPLSMLEAMAAGLPVIATRVGDIPTVVRPRVTGWLVEPGDVPGLENAIGEALSAPEARESMGKAAIELVSSAFDIRGTAAEYAKLYSSIGGGGRG